jgi:hypothetical protein
MFPCAATGKLLCVHEVTTAASLSTSPPLPPLIIQVDDVVDAKRVSQGERGYENPLIEPGDLILRVDGHDVQAVSLDQLHEMLEGNALCYFVGVCVGVLVSFPTPRVSETSLCVATFV